MLECIPNISEGNNAEFISALGQVISSVEGVRLLNVDSGKAANRTVYTFVGNPQAVVDAAFAMYEFAAKHLNMRTHKGTHPRAGIVDVCPLVPLNGMTMSEANEYALQLAQRVSAELHIPVYLYEHSAKYEHRTRLEQIRAGEYEGFAQKMQLPQWKPDFGEAVFNENTGITVIGVRKFLLAYNVNLTTKDVEIARKIAGVIREFRKKGLLRGVKAIGWYIEDFDMVQVSTNITDFEKTSLYAVFKTIQQLAQEYGCTVCGSEVIGLIPREALEQAGEEILRDFPQLALSPVQVAIDVLGLNTIKPFDETFILD
ncbi:MAG: glutamate formimidoyltransferase [Bacteroidetes bacterium]|nr:glutamate formimidoyltransferase [Bacteroidota bacterium]